MIPPISHGLSQNNDNGDNFTSLFAEEYLPTQEALASQSDPVQQQISRTLLSGSLIYHYLAFLLTMLVLDLALRIISGFIQKQKGNQLPLLHSLKADNSIISSTSWKSKTMRRMIFYSGIYCCYQVMMITLGFNNHDALLSTTISQIGKARLFEAKESLRLLEESSFEEKYVGPTMVNEEKISFSLGKVVSSLNLKANNIVVTKNLKYAFIAEASAATLKVIDISDWTAPSVVKTVPLLKRSSIVFRSDHVHLSPDEKTLFVSCLDTLQIIDVTLPELAQLIGTAFDPAFSRAVLYFVGERFSISFALSADSKTLVVGGLGLQTFDVSDLTKPILLSSQSLVFSIKNYSALSITLTSDKKTLWITNGTLDSYDFASDARNPKLLNSFSDGSDKMRSIILSRDNKIAFILGNIKTSGGRSQEIQLTKVDISNSSSPVLLKSYSFSQESLSPAFIVGLSAKERYLFISTNPGLSLKLIVFDLVEGKVLENDQSLLKDMGTVTVVPNGYFMLASSHTKLEMIKFYKSFPNKERFSLTEYPIGTFQMRNESNSIDFSGDEKYLFVAGNDLKDSNQTLYIFEFEDKKPKRLVSSFEVDSIYLNLRVSEDMKKVFLTKREEILIIDISNLQSPTLYAKYKVSGYSEIEDFYFWDEANIAFVMINRYDLGDHTELRVFDYSSPKSPKKIYSSNVESAGEQGSKLLFSKERSALLIVGSNLTIYDVSNASSPLAIGSIGICIDNNEALFFAKISADGKTLFAETMDRTSFHKFKIYNISDLRNVKLISEAILPMFKTNFGVLEAEVTQDSKTVYLLQYEDENILRIDLSNIKAPRVSGILPFQKKSVKQIKLSGDGKMMYLITNHSQIYRMSLETPQTLYLNQEKFYIGHGYSDNAMVLQFDEKSADYRLMKENEYKFIGMGLCEINIDSTEVYAKPIFNLLPNWASFDKTNHVLTIEPKRQLDLGYRTLFARISKKVPKNAFDSFLDSATESKDLITNLISLGYLNNQLFLTSEYGKLEDFYLPAKYENMTEQIYNTLAQYYIIACTTINILPSLEVKRLANGLSVISPSENHVKIEIQLSKKINATAQFVHRPYGSLLPTITDGKSHLSLEGSLVEINTALKNLTVDLTNIEGCSAEMLAMDGMNPSITVKINDVTKHFQINTPPIPNKSVQKQIDDIPVYTGQYFSITFDSDTIKDIHPDISLQYKLVLNATENNETLPSWISLNDLTLKGIAPEEFFGREIGFALIATNEFKNLTVPFVLHVRISSTYVAKLIARYSPYILTLVGLIIKANMIYNVVCKKRYRHDKEFIVQVGQEITNKIIFPIAFIGQEKVESQKIFDYMMKKKRFISEEGILDKVKIMECIQETVKEKIPVKERNQLEVYLYGVSSRKQIVERLVVYKFISQQLNRERTTRKTFEKIKNRWVDIIEWNNDFQVNQSKLSKILESFGVLQDKGSSNYSSLLGKSNTRLNYDLLVNALESYAFECQSIDMFAIKCTVEIKERLPGGCLKSVLKGDIHPINYDSPLKVNYGVNCRFENSSLIFSGTPCEDFKRKDLVVQIANGRLRILKEIWIFEGSGLKNVEFDWKSFENRSLVMKKEKEAQGQYYEVF